MKVRTHHWFVLALTLVSVPLWAALWLAVKYHGGVGAWRPWLLATDWFSLSETLRLKALQAGVVGGMLSFAGLMAVFHGAVFGVEPGDAHGDARWSTRGEIKKARLLNSWGVVLAKLGRPSSGGPVLRAHRVDHSNILVSAPPRSGKGVGVIIPTLLDYPGSVIVYDVKGENYEQTARLRASRGDRVRVLAPFGIELPDAPEGSLKGRSHSFNPLLAIAALEDLEDRLVEISALGAALLSPKSVAGTEAALLEDGRQIFNAACAIICNEPGPSLAQVLSILSPQPVDGETPNYKECFTELAGRAPDPISRNALLRMAGNDNKQIGIYMSVLSGAGLRSWDNPAIIRATEGNDFEFASMRDKAQSFYIAIPEAHKDIAAPLVRLFIQTAIRALQRKRPGAVGTYLPVLFMIDEFHTLGRMPGVLDAATILAGYGGRLCLVVQSPESLREHYGEAGAEILRETTHLKIWMAPNSDKTKAELSRALGTQTIAAKSVSSRSFWTSDDANRSDSWSEKGRALMTPEELGRMGDDKAIVTVAGMYPILAEKVRYYEDRRFAPMWRSQASMPWPEVPQIKAGVTRSFGEFLRKPGAVEPEPEPCLRGEPRIVEDLLATEVDDHNAGEPRPPATDHSAMLDRLMETVQAPGFGSEIEELLGAAPIAESDSEAFKGAARRLSAEELIGKVAGLFAAEDGGKNEIAGVELA